MKKLYFILFLLINFSVKAQDKVHILTPELYFDDEIDTNLITESWYGLFKTKNEFSLKKVEIKIEKTYHFMVEDENNQSGLLVNVNPVKPFILLSEFENLIEGKIEKAQYNKHEIAIGDTIFLVLNKFRYKIIGIGNIIENEKGNQILKDYKVIIEDKFGLKQEIGRTDFLDDTWYSIIWAGDLDNDGFLDLIMNTSNKYSYTNYVLFLSFCADKNNLFMKVGEHKKYHD